MIDYNVQCESIDLIEYRRRAIDYEHPIRLAIKLIEVLVPIGSFLLRGADKLVGNAHQHLIPRYPDA